jgi:integrase/recombinase XerD
MAKPDPIPNFIEISSSFQSEKTTVGIKADELDWVDQFLSDREIRPNTKRAYLRHLRQFQIWMEYKHWPEITEADITRYQESASAPPIPVGLRGW